MTLGQVADSSDKGGDLKSGHTSARRSRGSANTTFGEGASAGTAEGEHLRAQSDEEQVS